MMRWKSLRSAIGLAALSIGLLGAASGAEGPDKEAARMGGEDPRAREEADNAMRSGSKDKKWTSRDALKARDEARKMRVSRHLFQPGAWKSKLTLVGASMDVATAQAATVVGSGSNGVSLAAVTPTGANVWQNIGPMHIGGRTRTLLISPTNPNIMLLGSVSGGIWRTTDRGVNWAPVNDFLPNMAVSHLAQDPFDANVILAGTGESYTHTGREGAGILKSTDGGLNWNFLASTISGSSTPMKYVQHLAFSPVTRGLLFASTDVGLYRSVNGGASWTLVAPDKIYGVHFQPGNPKRMLASAVGYIRQSDDSGKTWPPVLPQPIPDGERIELAFSNSNPQIVYASVQKDAMLWRSDDGGSTWIRKFTGTGLQAMTYNVLRNQGYYDNCLWVHPTDPNTVLVGGITLWLTRDGGTTGGSVSTMGGGVHDDIHRITTDPAWNGTGNPTIYVNTDGGLYRIDDFMGSNRVASLNSTLPIVQIVGMDVMPGYGYISIGTQDNDSYLYQPNFGWQDCFTAGSHNAKSDGGETVFAPRLTGDGKIAMMTSIQELIFAMARKLVPNEALSAVRQEERMCPGETEDDPYVPCLVTVSVHEEYFKSGLGSTDKFPFYPAMVVDSNYGPGVQAKVLYGGTRLHKMDLSQQPSGSEVVRAPLTGASPSFISAIGVAPGNSQRVLVGYESGRLDGTRNLSTISATTWSTLGASALPAGRRILSIKFDPTDAKTIYVTYAGANANNIWRSRDDGATWTALKGALPSASVYDLAILPENPKVLYAATEVGLFASADGGDSWGAPESGPSLTTVRKLKYVDGKLVVGTYGRGVYQLDLKSTSLESPTGFVVTTGNLSASLSWGAVSGASGYQVEIAEGASGPWSTASQVSGTNYVHNSFPKRIPYWFRVKALAGTVPGVATTSISVYPFTPDAPANPTATAGIAKVSLAWSQVAQATSYVVERSNSATGTFTSVGSVSSASFEDINLTAGTTYYYRIVGSNALGRGTPSSVVQATPFADPAAWSDLDIGTGVGGSHTVSGQVHTVKAGGNDIWNLSDNFHFTYRKLTGDGSLSAKVSSLSIVSGSMDPWAKAGLMIREKLTPGSRHAMMEMTSGNGALFQYRQTENGGCGNNIQSGLKAPYWVKIVRQGNVLSGYQSPDGTNWSQIAGANVTLTNLPADLYIGMAVTAHSTSAVVSGVFDLAPVAPLPPPAPANFAAVPANGQISLSWSAVQGATSYEVRRWLNDPAQKILVFNGSQTSFVNTGLTNGLRYSYEVSSVNASGTGPASAAVSATVGAQIPSAPQNLRAVAGDASVSLTWDVASGATSYKVRRWATSNPSAVTETNTTTNSSSLSGLTNGTSYSFSVIATNASGSSAASATVAATPAAPQTWTEIDIDSWGGSRVVSGTTHTVKGSGSDIWNNSDQFHFSYRTLSGNGTLVAKVVSLGNTNAWAKAGLMFRETTSGNSRNVMVNVTPSNGVLLQKRMNPGEATTNTIVSGKAVPQWLKLTRSGNTFTGYLSADGTNWTQVGSPVVFGSFSSTALVGLAVTSHNSGAVTTAVFDNVTIP